MVAKNKVLSDLIFLQQELGKTTELVATRSIIVYSSPDDTEWKDVVQQDFTEVYAALSKCRHKIQKL